MLDIIKHIVELWGRYFYYSNCHCNRNIGIRSKRSFVKQVCYNLSAVFIALFIYEVWPVSSNTEMGTHMEGTFTQDYFGDNEVLGYGPSKDSMTITSRKVLNGSDKVVYDVIYTIRQGLRYTPNSKNNSKKYAVFFGGSFMFGSCLNDNETMPYSSNVFAFITMYLKTTSLKFETMVSMDTALIKPWLLLSVKL